MIDINNLPDILKHGRIIGTGNRAILETPLARASFCNLVEEEDFNGPTGRHSITLMFETDERNDACVDSSMVVAFFDQMIKEYGLKHLGQTSPDYIINGQKLFTTGIKMSRDGKPYTGYTSGTLSLKANSKISTLNPSVPCYDATGQEVEPATIYAGCYVRAKIGLYKPPTYPNLSITLKSVQFVADGEQFTSDGLTMDGIEGAEPAAPASTPDDLSQFV